MKTIETYKTLKRRQSDELNAFDGIFFAFSNKQFYEGMKKVGLEPDETGKIYSLKHGGYLLKERAKAWKDMFTRHDAERKQAREDKKHLLESITYELINHEYCITYDTGDALRSLGLEESDVPKDILKKAKEKALESLPS